MMKIEDLTKGLDFYKAKVMEAINYLKENSGVEYFENFNVDLLDDRNSLEDILDDINTIYDVFSSWENNGLSTDFSSNWINEVINCEYAINVTWSELHSNTITINAKSLDEALSYAKENSKECLEKARELGDSFITDIPDTIKLSKNIK